MLTNASDREKQLDRQIGDAVRRRRDLLGVTQASLGAAIGVTFQQIQKYERGVNRISASKLVLIADALACEVGELIGQETAAPPGAGVSSAHGQT